MTQIDERLAVVGFARDEELPTVRPAANVTQSVAATSTQRRPLSS